MGELADLHPTAFVTGASAGLGRSIAKMLLAEGLRVWGTARNPADLADLAVEGGGRFIPVDLDLANPDDAVAAFSRCAVEAHAAREAGAAGLAGGGGAFDLVINSAGYGIFGPFDQVEARAWGAQVKAMLGTTLALSHAAFGPMRKRGCGCLVNISSLAAEFPLPFMSGYNVAKAGLSALSASLILEARRSAVAVIDFRPGDYRTHFNQAMRKASQISPDDGTLPVLPADQARAWAALEANLNSAPEPERAAADLRRAILRNRSGVVRSGSFFQARVAPALARLAPTAWVREATARYYGLG